MSLPLLPTDVLVVGAGSTGLTAGFRLREAGLRPHLLELADRAGGVLQTEIRNGYHLELGPNTLLATPAVRQLLAAVGLEAHLQEANRAHNTRYVLRGGQLRGMRSPRDVLFGGALSVRGRLRLLAEPFRRRFSPSANPTVHQFFAHRLGHEAAEVLVDAFVGGVWAGNPRHLEMRSAFRSLWEGAQKYGSLARYLSAERRAARGKPKPVVFRLPGGLQQLTDTLAAHLGQEHITFGARVTGLSRAENGWVAEVEAEGTLRRYLAPAVALTLPAHALGHLLAPLWPEMGTSLIALPHPQLRMVHLGYKASAIERPLDGFGFLVPHRENLPLLGAIWNSAQFSGLAPEGHVLFTLFGGGSRRPTPPTAAALIDAFGAVMGIRHSPAFVSETLWEKSIPQYEMGHHHLEARAAELEHWHTGLFLAGNWRGGVGVPDRIAAGEALAQSIVAQRR